MSAATPPLTVIRSSQGRLRLGLGELYRYRDLLWALVVRDIRVRYTQTLLGAAWAILQPLLLMLLFTFVFGRMARVETSVPYPLFALSALVPWTYFANALSQSGNSVVSHAAIITKIYFPRLLLPISSVISGLLDFALSFLLLVGMLLLYGQPLTPRLLFVPVLVALASLAALSVGLWLSALNALYRDIRYTIPFLVQLWLFASPVIYPLELVQKSAPGLAPWYMLNPMVGVIEGFRWALFDKGSAPSPMMFLSFLSLLVVLVGGLAYFRWMERTFADVV
jgi:lipopolysaccharide transport system permease protein